MCFGFDPASAVVQKQNTQNVYLRTDDKRCTRILVGRVRQSRKGRTRENCNYEQKQYLRALPQGTTLPCPLKPTHRNGIRIRRVRKHVSWRVRTHFLPLVSLSHPLIHPPSRCSFLSLPSLSSFLPRSLSPLDKSSIVSPTASSPLGVARSHQSHSELRGASRPFVGGSVNKSRIYNSGWC